ncbi:MAG TPA: amidohydrolase family protein [Acidimicrobiales bacterium]|jgi:predicted TIM-barrel fold metal-dependent hydrolase|nr:amidohydrolase family protein [Acidimicrobiales bacterium]
MSEKWDEGDRYVVISADTHAGADLLDYKPYLASQFHDAFDEWAKSYISPFDDLIIATAKRNWDSEFRVSEMDADGVAAELLFPNTVPPFFPTSPNITISLPRTREEFEQRWAGVQAHNRWQIDFCSLAPNRRRGLIQVFPNDVEKAIEEIKWGVEQGCFGAVLVPAVSPGDEVVAPLFHTRYEPLWALCHDLDLTIVQHSGAGSPIMPMDQPASNPVLITEMASWAQRTLPHLILAGVFERYPNLRFVPTEQGTYWVRAQLMTLDAMVPTMKSSADNRTYGVFGGSSVDELTMSPSEYVQRNVYFGASALGPYEKDMIRWLGADHILWGSDYPHEEGTTPDSKIAIQWALHDQPVEDTRQILAGNAGRLYGFDLDALAPVAAEIGPRVEDVHQPLGDTGYMAPLAFQMRPFEGGLALKRMAPARS